MKIRRPLLASALSAGLFAATSAHGAIITIDSGMSNQIAPLHILSPGSFNLTGALSPGATITSATVTAYFSDPEWPLPYVKNYKTEYVSTEPILEPSPPDTTFNNYGTKYIRNILNAYYNPFESVTLWVGSQNASMASSYYEEAPAFIKTETTAVFTTNYYWATIPGCVITQWSMPWETCVYSVPYQTYDLYVDSYYDQVLGYGGPFQVAINLDSSNLQKIYTGQTLDFGIGVSNGWPLVKSAKLEITTQEQNIVPEPAAVTSPVPEPETYAMLLAGLGLLSFTARRRKKNA